MKKFLIILALSSASFAVSSQAFMREAGLRGGFTSGLSYRHYLDDNLSYEGILSFRKSGVQFTLLRQIHERNPLLDFDDNFRFIYGYGGHVGFYYTDNYKPFGYTQYYYPYKRFSPLIGINGYAAFEYRMDSFPLVLGMDYKPFFEFSLYQFFKLRLWDLAFTIRYRF